MSVIKTSSRSVLQDSNLGNEAVVLTEHNSVRACQLQSGQKWQRAMRLASIGCRCRESFFMDATRTRF